MFKCGGRSVFRCCPALGCPGKRSGNGIKRNVMLPLLLSLHKEENPLLCLGKKWLIFDGSLLWKTFSYGITSALQQMCVQLGKICVQTVVNVQGVEFIAAFTAINRVDDFAMTPQQNIAHASTTFMAQNRGAGKIERMKKGFFSSILLQAIYTAVIAVVTFFFARQIMKLFVGENSEEVVSLGVSYLVLIAPMYVMPAATNIIPGIFPGIGRFKGHTDQYHPEYVRQIFNSPG